MISINEVAKSSINKTINCITNLMNWSSQKEDKNDIYNQIEFYKNYIKYFINGFSICPLIVPDFNINVT